MQRVFTIELTASEALTVHRMSKVSGRPAEAIVRHLRRSALFDAAVSLATGVWEYYDPDTGKCHHDRSKQRAQFWEITDALLDEREEPMH